MHDAPQIEGIGLVAHNALTWFGVSSFRCHFHLTDLGFVFLMVTMENDAGAVHHVVPKQLVQVFVFFGEEGEEGVLR